MFRGMCPDAVLLMQVRAAALSRECRLLDEIKYHIAARRHGAEDEFVYAQRMQVDPQSANINSSDV